MKRPATNRRLARCSKNISSGTNPGTATTVQPVAFINRSFNSAKSGMPGFDSRSTSSPSRNGCATRPGSNAACRANSVSQTPCSAAVYRPQSCGIVQSVDGCGISMPLL